jgi:hypothetical protein
VLGWGEEVAGPLWWCPAGRAGSADLRWPPLEVDEAAGLADRAPRRVDAGQPLEALLPGLGLAVTVAFLGGLWGRHGEQLPAVFEVGGPESVGEEPVVSDAVKAIGQNVEQIAADELRRFEMGG